MFTYDANSDYFTFILIKFAFISYEILVATPDKTSTRTLSIKATAFAAIRC